MDVAKLAKATFHWQNFLEVLYEKNSAKTIFWSTDAHLLVDSISFSKLRVPGSSYLPQESTTHLGKKLYIDYVCRYWCCNQALIACPCCDVIAECHLSQLHNNIFDVPVHCHLTDSQPDCSQLIYSTIFRDCFLFFVFLHTQVNSTK